MSWLSWFRNLWQSPESPSATLPRRVDPESTQDYPSAPIDVVSDTATTTTALSAGGFRLQVGVVSTTGNVREHNEDNYYVPGRASLNNGVGAKPKRPDLSTAEFPAVPDGPQGLFIVADGMGGQLAGEKASQMAVELIPREVSRRLAYDADDRATQKALRESVARANDEILALSHVGTEYANMGTTVVLVQFKDNRAYVAGIGDSRAYRLRDGKFDQLTKDHSLANALAEAQTIRPEEVETHKFKHVLYLYLGSKDARDGPDDVRVVDVRAGDQFLLASDGLVGVVRDEMIADILIQNDDPQKAAQMLVDRALELRSKDNITAVVIHLV